MDPIKKGARLLKAELDENELGLINAQTLRPVTEEEIFTFKLAACNNQVDREWERFTDETLDGFAKLFVGRPILRDHDWETKNQTARVYAAGVEPMEGVDGGKQLVLRCYMLRSGHEDTVAAIEAGILRECSVGVAVREAVCSICGVNQRTGWCEHRGGREYDGVLCHFELTGAEDAYETSMVAVPAQPAAGVIKSKRYGGPEEPPADPQGKEPQKAGDWQDEALLELEKNRF